MSVEQKLNFGRNMNRFTENKLSEAFQAAGKILPASIVSQSGKMVTVAFELHDTSYVFPQVTIPLFGPQYIRYPMQPGDKGIVIPGDTYLGGVSGQGGGVADLTPPANLSALVFLPISNTEWDSVDGQVVTIYGPEGVTIRDQSSNTTFLLTPDSIAIQTVNQFKVTVGDTVLTLTQGMWSLTGTAGKLEDSTASTSPAIMHAGWAALVSWLNAHAHTNGNGGANTGSPTTPFNGNITE
ncbi:hypothetical protein NP142_14250 [Salmonella enterica]|uniref:hypothetical protein n=1 Tax=Salmonella TaxID=590 RepID=UPI000B61BCF1|nr:MULTISPECIES: hypothetical protein [Salmonella]ASN57532.1 hypothetical protein CGL53_18515 [Salmonella enterica subsp. enterica serovar Indiana]EEJ2275957.1 hypothetical protein [Salmonella enterica subsp. enterica]MBJ5712941.1 hypothetical protein [Salmonella enterica subsp. enterica serovar Indiana]MBJ6087374.1 hypothetical protein [Salmonella enterica subsp. enterica serovar Indiana]MBM8358768.1 hypothetical protein [Salmonella enterica]